MEEALKWAVIILVVPPLVFVLVSMIVIPVVLVWDGIRDRDWLALMGGILLAMTVAAGACGVAWAVIVQGGQ